MSEAAELAAIDDQRGATYWLLARLVLEPPTLAFLRELNATLATQAAGADQPLGAEVARLARAVDDAVSGTPSELDLRVEHTRLWGGLSKQYGPPPPFESVFREQRSPGESTTAVATMYAEADLDPEVAEAGPADHLAIELRFMSLCCIRSSQARRDDDEVGAAEWLERQRRFLDDHLLCWAPAHCQQVADASRTDYHRAAAALIARACELDRDDVEAQRGDSEDASE